MKQSMNFLEKLNISRKVLLARIFKRKIPLAVSFNITYRCNLQCRYCRYREREVRELSTKEIFRLIEELSYLGSRFITFTGGEPLLREDFGDIIEFCRKKNIQSTVNSNGTLVKAMIEEIKGISHIQISLDGPRHINDFIRGAGVHDKVIEAIEACKKEKIKVNIVTVISKHNISHIPYILELAEKYDIGVYFQPADRNLSGDTSKGIPLIPEEGDYKKVIAYLIKKKSQGCVAINTSLSGLRHLYNWPKPKKIFCSVSLCHFFIEPDGKIFICDAFPHHQRFLIPVNTNLKESFDNLSFPYPCEECWGSSMVEFNLTGNFKLDSMLNVWKRL